MAEAPTPYGIAEELFPGTAGELYLQGQYGTSERAETFYKQQVVDALTPRMADFLARQTMMIVASVDTDGAPDVSVRFGEAGFVKALDDRTLAWPEMRGNGVFTTLGNLAKTPSAHLMFLDHDHRIGLHIRGEAEIVESEDMLAAHPPVATAPRTGRAPERWVIMRVRNGYIHCRKHFPQNAGPTDWGTDDVAAKGGDYFGAKHTPKPWSRRFGRRGGER